MVFMLDQFVEAGEVSKQGTKVIERDGSSSLCLPGIKLSVVDGPDRGLETKVRRGVVRVGSAPDNDLILADPAVSRRHLEIRLRSDQILVNDLGSTNGTQVDGVSVLKAFLTPAALVRIGDTVIRVSTANEPVIVPLSSRESFGSMIGQSIAMREVFAIMERVAPTEATVLVEGETGTGKELAAEAIHGASLRADGPFIPLDCGAIAASLMESEIFGHVKGAFTGAISDRKGAFEEAHGGTLFLDEIGELPLDLQPKLLRVLEKREIKRIGSSQIRPVSVRVIAATNRDLAAEVNLGNFREDLYYRIAVCRVVLPPLRSRSEDISMLIHHFLDRIAPDAGGPSDELVEALSLQSWPGNVRELRNAIERAVAMAGVADDSTSHHKLDDAGLRETMRSFFALPYKEGYERWTGLFERGYLEYILHQSGGSVSGAAKIAGVNRRFLQRLMKRHGMTRDDLSDH